MMIKASSYIILRSPAEFAQKDSKNAVKAATKLKQNKNIWDLAYKEGMTLGGGSCFCREFYRSRHDMQFPR